jgi:ParB/RepB/Spo0J family partition protein
MNNVRIAEIVITAIDVSTNPRDVRKKDVTELAASIKRVGVTVPIAVRQTEQGNTFELICGGRRVEAAQQAGLQMIPALVYPADTPNSEIVNMTHFENAFRKELKPMDEARSVKKIYDECGSYSDTATILGKTAQQVAMCVNIIKGLSKSWTKEFKKKASEYEPTILHMELLARLSDEVQERLYEETSDWDFNELDDFKRICSKEQRNLSEAIWDTLILCGTCPKRTGIQQDLFGVTKKGELGECLDKECWKEKYNARIKGLLELAEETHENVKYGTDGYLQWGEECRVKETFGKCIDLADTEKAKKSEDGAFALFIVAGKKIGKTMWRKLPKGKKVSADGTGPGTGPKTLKVRRDGLMRKRWSFVNATLVKLLSGDWDITQLKYADKVHAVMYLVTCFGVKTFDTNKLAAIDKIIASKDMAKVTTKLFDMMEECFIHELRWNGPLTQITNEYINLTKKVADLFVVDIDAITIESVNEYPEPKSWANLKADGTPKK